MTTTLQREPTPAGSASPGTTTGAAAPTSRLFARVRRTARSAIVIEGLAAIAVAFVGFMAVSYLLDRTLRLEVGFRAALLLGLSFVLVRLWWQRVAVPWRVALTDDELALAVERREAGMRQALISAVQFERRLQAPGRDAESRVLMASVVQDVHRRLPAIGFHRAVDRRRVARYASAGVAAVALALGWFALDPSARLWAKRNLLLSSIDWPRLTQLRFAGIAEGGLRVPQGDDLTLDVDAEGVVPEQVWLHYTFAGGSSGREAMTLTGERRFSYTLQAVLESGKVHAVGGDGETLEVPIQVVERPRLGDLEVTLVHPEYVHREPTPLTQLEGDLRVPQGSRLRFTATASKPLEAAFVLFGEDGRQALEVEGGTRIQGEFSPQATGLVVLDVLDRDRLGAGQPPRLYLRLVADEAPLLDFKTTGIGPMITPTARIPGRLKAKDDYGLQALSASMRLAAEATRTDALPRPQSGETPAEGSGQPQAPGASPAAAPSEPAFEPAPFAGLEGFAAGGDTFVADVVMDLKPLAPEADPDAAGNKVRPGQLLTVRFSAKDNWVPEAHEAHSELLTFRVVTREELLAELRRRQQEQRHELELVLKEEKADRDELREILSPAESDARAAQARQRVRAIAREQRSLGKRCTGVALAFQQILDEMANNRLHEPNDIRTWQEAIVVPLNRLAADGFPSSAELVEDFAASGQEDVRAAIVSSYDSIIQRLEAILKSIQEAEKLSDLLERLKQIIQLESSLSEDLHKQRLEQGKAIFENPQQPPQGQQSPDGKK